MTRLMSIAFTSVLAVHIFAFLLALPAVSGDQDGRLILKSGIAKVVSIPDGASDVIIGNPDIAAVVLLNKRTILVTPHKAGITNVIILSPDKTPLHSFDIAVDVDYTVGTVQVFRQIGNGAKPETFDCADIRCRQIKDGALPIGRERSIEESLTATKNAPVDEASTRASTTTDN